MILTKPKQTIHSYSCGEEKKQKTIQAFSLFSFDSTGISVVFDAFFSMHWTQNQLRLDIHWSLAFDSMHNISIACKKQVIWRRYRLVLLVIQMNQVKSSKPNIPIWMRIGMAGECVPLFAYNFSQDTEMLPNYSHFGFNSFIIFHVFFHSFLSRFILTHTMTNRIIKHTHAQPHQQRWAKANASTGKCPASAVYQTKADKWRKTTQQFDSIHTIPWAPTHPAIVDGCQRCSCLSQYFWWTISHFRWKHHTNGAKSHRIPAENMPAKAVS